MKINNNNKNDSEKLSLSAIRKKFNRLVRRTYATIFTERALPKIIAPTIIGSGFLAATWAGLWTVLPLEAKIVGVVAFATAAALSPLIIKSGSSLVRRKDVIKRLDAPISQNERPAQTLDDKLSDTSDKTNQAIWDIHIRTIWKGWKDHLKSPKIQPNLNKYDPYKLRYVAPFCAALAGGFAGEDRQTLLQDAFNWQTPVVAEVEQPLNIIAWVTPPNLPHLAPIHLNTAEIPKNTEQHIDSANPAVINTHESSQLTVVIAGGNTNIAVNGTNIDPSTILDSRDDDEIFSAEYHIQLDAGDITVDIENGPNWLFSVTEDTAPIASIESVIPSPNSPTTLSVICEASDDFGIESGRIIFQLPDTNVSDAENDDATINQQLDSAELPTVSLPRRSFCAP